MILPRVKDLHCQPNYRLSCERGNDMIKVLIVDNNHLVRDGIRLRLGDSDALVIVGEAENGLEALKFCLKN